MIWIDLNNILNLHYVLNYLGKQTIENQKTFLFSVTLRHRLRIQKVTRAINSNYKEKMKEYRFHSPIVSIFLKS